MAKRKAKKSGTPRRRTHRRKSHSLLGAMPGNAMEKIIGIAAGTVGTALIEEQIERRSPVNPLVLGAGEIIIGAFMSDKPGLMGSVGDGMIATGSMNLASALRARMQPAGPTMNGPNYVVTGGPEYVTGDDAIMVDGEGFLMTGDGYYITGPNGEYITEHQYHSMMGDVNQGGLGDVNQGGLG